MSQRSLRCLKLVPPDAWSSRQNPQDLLDSRQSVRHGGHLLWTQLIPMLAPHRVLLLSQLQNGFRSLRIASAAVDVFLCQVRIQAGFVRHFGGGGLLALVPGVA